MSVEKTSTRHVHCSTTHDTQVRWSALCHHGQDARHKPLKGGKVCSGSQLERCQSMLSLLHCSRPGMRQSIMAEKVWWNRDAALLGAREQRERVKEKARDQEQDIVPKVTPPLTHFHLLQFPPPPHSALMNSIL